MTERRMEGCAVGHDALCLVSMTSVSASLTRGEVNPNPLQLIVTPLLCARQQLPDQIVGPRSWKPAAVAQAPPFLNRADSQDTAGVQS